MSQVLTQQTRPSDDPTPYLSHPDALYEVEDGVIVELPEMGVYAGIVALTLYNALHSFLLAHGLGRAVVEFVFVLDAVRDLRRRPDVAFVSFDRWPADREVPEEGDWEVVPDLAIEVVSPHDTDRQVTGKVRKYFQYGVRQVWIVRPLDKTVYVYSSPTSVRIYGTEEELASDLLPGFQLPVGPLFQRTLS